MKKTIVVNLFAGPGAGKSTGACSVYSAVKMNGIDCEYVSEFAKDKVWEHNDAVMKCQFYISGKQAFKISRVYGKVDVIITDSPILLGAFYGEKTSEKLKEAIVEEYSKYNNLNIFIERCKEYNPNGRMQTKEEALEIDKKIKEMLDKYKIDYTTVRGDLSGYVDIVKMIDLALTNSNAEEQLTDEVIEKFGGIKLEEGWRLLNHAVTNNGIDSGVVKFNEHDNTWIYSDYRNRVYGIKTVAELLNLLSLIGFVL